MSKIAIVGSRDYKTLSNVKKFVYSLSIFDVVISGGALGVDAFAMKNVRDRGLGAIVILPDYKTHGRSAPIIRNAEIVERADKVVAFWDGESKGTKNVIETALREKKELKVFFSNRIEEESP